MPPLTANTLVADRYALTEPAPDRGLGETWRARDLRREGATVQLKFLRAVAGDDIPPDALKVIRALRALRHPVIPSVVNQGTHAGRPWIASDDILGDSVGARLDRSRGRGELLDLALIRQLFDGVAAALTAAHTAPLPVLHGALTPGSVVVLARPVRGASCALLDLGLAPWLDPPTDLVARSARALITPAPELARGGTPAVATDVFSLAALLTELLATPTSPGETMMAVSAARRRTDVPAGVWGVLEQAMALRPDERFQSVDALATALGRAWSEAQPPARPTALESLASRAPTGPSSLLETYFPESAPRASAPVPDAAPVVAAQTPQAPLLGAMPALALPPEPARPPGWENPWSTMLIQGKAPAPKASEPDDLGATLMEPMRSRPPAAENLGATVTMGAASVPLAGARDPSMGEVSPDATLIAGPARRAEPPLDGTLLAAPRPSLPRAEAPAWMQPPQPVAMAPAPTMAPAAPTASAAPTGGGMRTVLMVVGFVVLFMVVATAAYQAAR